MLPVHQLLQRSCHRIGWKKAPANAETPANPVLFF